MKRLINSLLVSIIILLPCAILAQGSTPLWLDNDIRNIQYSQDAYYTGFSEVTASQNEEQEKALERAKQFAIGELSERVRVMVASNKTSVDVSISGSDIEEQIHSKFSSMVKVSSQIEVIGSKVETYYDRKTRTAYAFAYVGRTELQNYYQNQISFLLNKVEGTLQTASEMVEKGYKMKAYKQCESMVDVFASVFYAQDLLIAINEGVSDNILQQSRGEHLRNTLIQTITDLENSTYIYIECAETVNEQSVTYIAERLSGMITEKGLGCNFTDLKEEADYIIKVNAHLVRCSDAQGNMEFCYARATVSVYNIHTQKNLMPKIDEAKGGWTNQNKAIEEAFNKLADRIAEKIVPIINN